MRVMIWAGDGARELELSDDEWELLKRILLLMDEAGMGERITVEIPAQ